MRKLFLFCLSIFSLIPVFGQLRFGNEWIDFSQPHLKIRLKEEGLFQLTHASLSNAGFPTGTDPRQWQLFYRGVEQPLLIYGEEDGSFDPGDLLLFYGKPNDCSTENALFTTGGPINPEVNLFSDTSNYFLRNSNQAGKRYKTNDHRFFGAYTPVNTIRQEALYVFNQEYFDGQPASPPNASPGSTFYNPAYGPLEGWMSTRFGSTQTFTLNTPQKKAGSNQVVLKGILAGANNQTAYNPNHQIVISVSNDGSSYTDVLDTSFTGYQAIVFNINLNPALLGNITYVRFTPKVPNELFVIAHFGINYDRNPDLNGAANLRYAFSYPAGTDTLSYFNLNNANAGYTRPYIVDTENELFCFAQKSGAAINGLLPKGVKTGKILVSDSALLKTPLDLRLVTFTNLDPGNNTYDYLIVTHSSLSGAAGRYATYRQSTGYNPLVMTTQELFDQFSYGQYSPLAIRHFADYLLEEGQVKPKFMLLLGKGIMVQYLRNPVYNFLNLVPSIGTPTSEALFTAGLDSTIMEMAIPTGRITAVSEADIDNYLEKVKTYEAEPHQTWHKRVIHLGGGEDDNQKRRIESYYNNLNLRITSPYLGANLTKYFKLSSAAVFTDIKNTLIKEFADGTRVLTFFGHGSSNLLDIDFGTGFDQQNPGKYPLFYINGCSTGNTCAEYQFNPNLADGFIITANKGGIGWLGHATTTYEYVLARQMNAFYEELGVNSYGQPIGTVLKNTVKAMTDTLDKNFMVMTYSLNYQGDPAVVIVKEAQPDYSIAQNSIYITPEDAQAVSDSFGLVFTLQNTGKALPDSFDILIKRSLPDGNVINYTVTLHPSTAYQEVFTYWIKSKDAKTQGINLFEITVDANNAIPESNEGNNTASLQYFMPGNGVRLIYPQAYDIVDEDTITLRVITGNIQGTNLSYIFEIDTVPWFDEAPSPWKKNSGPVYASNICDWQVALLPQDSVVYYWRARVNIPVDEGGVWENRSFQYINGSAPGWAQAHFPQLNSVSLNEVSLDSANRSFRFSTQTLGVRVVGNRLAHSFRGIFTDQSGSSLAPGACGELLLIIFHKYSLGFAELNKRCVGTASARYRYYLLYNTQQLDSLARTLNSLEDSFYVAGFTRYSSNIVNWGDSVYNAFERIGCVLPRTALNDTANYVFIGRKGWAPGTAYEQLSYAWDPSTNGDNVIYNFITGRKAQGDLTTVTIGPATSWGSLYQRYRSEDNGTGDAANIDIHGIRKDGTDTVLMSGISNYETDISRIPADIYPYIYLKSHLTDNINRTAPIPERWQVFYGQAPEGTINPLIRSEFHLDTIQEAAPARVRVAFQSLTKAPFDSLLVQYTLTRADRKEIWKVKEKLAPMQGLDTIILEKTFDTRNLSGNYTLEVLVNPALAQPEQLLENNRIRYEFHVRNDLTNPFLDVTFDGIHIFNNDIVSAKPLIQIALRDENKLLGLQDTGRFSIYLTAPGASVPQRLSMADPQLQFTPAAKAGEPAQVSYTPQLEEDGTYTLAVNATDASGNSSGAELYSIDFQVINKSTVTNFYPYPNPFTTHTQFVFTLTGSEIPENIRIQILNINGKVVREISRAELGPLRIGNNITDFRWDGTDQYGDALANGVYLYRVVVKKNGQQVEHRESGGDTLFEKGFGKLYLMR